MGYRHPRHARAFDTRGCRAIARAAETTQRRPQSVPATVGRAVDAGNDFTRSRREAVSDIKGTGVRLPFPANA